MMDRETATEQFAALVEIKVRKEASKADATREVVAEHPDLHEAAFHFGNTSGKSNKQAVIRFKELVRKAVASGMSESEAVRDVANRYPEAHQAYIDAVNARPQ